MIGEEQMRGILLEGFEAECYMQDVPEKIIQFHRRELLDETILPMRFDTPREITHHWLHLANLYELDDYMVVAVPRKKWAPLVLTESVSSYSELLRREGIRVTSVEDAERWIRHSLAVTRDYRRKFIVVEHFHVDIPYSSDNERGKREKEAEKYADGIRPLVVEKEGDNAYVGVIHVLVARTLIRRTIRITVEGQLAYEDVVLGKKVGTITDIHED